MESREARIRAKAHQLWQEDGKPDGLDRVHWERAAQIVDAEDLQAARAKAAPGQPPVPGVSDGAPGNDPIGVTLTAMRRRH
jgi:hypothetical protein